MTYEVAEIYEALLAEGHPPEEAEELARKIVRAYQAKGFRLTNVDGPGPDD